MNLNKALVEETIKLIVARTTGRLRCPSHPRTTTAGAPIQPIVHTSQLIWSGNRSFTPSKVLFRIRDIYSSSSDVCVFSFENGLISLNLWTIFMKFIRFKKKLCIQDGAEHCGAYINVQIYEWSSPVPIMD